MKRLLCSLIFSAGLAAAGETVELSAASPRDAAKTCQLHITRLEAKVTMRGMLAETQATLTLAVDADPALKMEGRLVFPLPVDGVLTGAALDIGEIMRPASVTFKETAKKAYAAVVSRMLDPCLIQLLPDGRVSVQVFPFTGGVPRKLRLEFAQTVLPGAPWQFPLKLAAPVPADLITDAPGQKSVAERADFSGDWSFAGPAEAKEIRAHPDGTGRWLFQTLLPPGEPADPPRHVLLLADASVIQSRRDAPAERAFLERLFQKMQTGRVTLATFSTVLHSQADYMVQDGKCVEALAAMESLTFDGAPRPGAVDVSGIPADFTLVLSTLAAPMGGGSIPRLPANAPVWVLDSVSRTPSAAARRLASQTGGMALDPRSALEISLRQPQPVTAKNVNALEIHTLQGGVRLVTGELSGDPGEITAGTTTRLVTKGTDPAAGSLIARFRSRDEFLLLAEDSRALQQANLSAGKNAAPFLTAATAFIVLEQEWDYTRFGIPLPPDLAKAEPVKPGALEQMEQDEFDSFTKSLQRPGGTKGDPAVWHRRLRSYEKNAELGQKLNNEGRFYDHRQPARSRPDAFGFGKEFDGMQKKEAQARTELQALAERFGASGQDKVAELIRLARERQLIRVKHAEGLEIYLQTVNSGGATGIDPINFEGLLRRGGTGSGADPFAGSGAGSGWGPAGGDASADPFGASAEPLAIIPPVAAAVETPAAVTPSSGSPQVPQTFGGSGGWPWGGDIFEGGRNGTPPNTTQKPAEAARLLAAFRDATLTRATALHRAGTKPEAIRALSTLAIPGQDHHALLRLLAWMLQEWGEPALAVEVLEQAEQRFGESETTLRDLGLALLAAGRKDDALTHFHRANHHVARRDLEALNGRMSAGLRVVVECAGEDGDVDLEIEGPDYELCSWRNPLPGFGGALSFDGKGMAPEDFVLPELAAIPLKLRVRLHGEGAVPVRLTITEQWGRPEAKARVIVIPRCRPGKNVIAEQ